MEEPTAYEGYGEPSTYVAGGGELLPGEPHLTVEEPVEQSVDGPGERPVLFRAACPECRTSCELVADELRLAVGGSRKTTFYSFVCPGCEAPVRKPAGERIVELLSGCGVSTLRLQGVQG